MSRQDRADLVGRLSQRLVHLHGRAAWISENIGHTFTYQGFDENVGPVHFTGILGRRFDFFCCAHDDFFEVREIKGGLATSGKNGFPEKPKFAGILTFFEAYP